MPDDKSRVNLLIDSDLKSDWEAHVDESDQHTSLSQMIRFAVAQQMRNDQQGNTGTGTDDELRKAIGEVLDRTQRMETSLENLSGRLRSVENNMREAPDDVQDLAGRVLGVLPTESEVGRTSADVMTDDEVDPYIKDGTVMSGRIGDIADHLGVERFEVRRAIDHLQESSSLVRSQVIEGDERFYRRG